MVVLGYRKTSAIHRFLEDEFIEMYYPTVELVHDQKISVGGVEYEVHIIDSAGQVS
ncbi:hypothetical protein EC988_007957 [Linderina pennispora]|nr:hypothetical protein EC988_007957 [Linderina pennispora]